MPKALDRLMKYMKSLSPAVMKQCPEGWEFYPWVLGWAGTEVGTGWGTQGPEPLWELSCPGSGGRSEPELGRDLPPEAGCRGKGGQHKP